MEESTEEPLETSVRNLNSLYDGIDVNEIDSPGVDGPLLLGGTQEHPASEQGDAGPEKGLLEDEDSGGTPVAPLPADALSPMGLNALVSLGRCLLPAGSAGSMLHPHPCIPLKPQAATHPMQAPATPFGFATMQAATSVPESFQPSWPVAAERAIQEEAAAVAGEAAELFMAGPSEFEAAQTEAEAVAQQPWESAGTLSAWAMAAAAGHGPQEDTWPGGSPGGADAASHYDGSVVDGGLDHLGGLPRRSYAPSAITSIAGSSRAPGDWPASMPSAAGGFEIRHVLACMHGAAQGHMLCSMGAGGHAGKT